MAITTYAQLKTALALWLGNSDSATAATVGITSSIDDLVTIAENRIFRQCRTKDMENALSASISSGVLAVPTGYVQMKYAYIDGTPVQKLERRSPEWIYTNYATRSASGKPVFFAREASNFIFGPYPDSSYTVKGIYYKHLGALSAGVNALFTANPDLYLFACLAESEVMIGRDSRIQLWEAKYKNILDMVNGETENDEHTGSTLQMRVG